MSLKTTIVRKIQALLRLSKGNGTEAEMSAALEKAQALIDKYKIDQSELNERQRSPVEIGELGEFDFMYEASIIQSVCSLNAVVPIFSEEHKYVLVGSRENQELACLMMNFVFDQFDEIMIKNDFGDGEKNRAFANGLALGIHYKCSKIIAGIKDRPVTGRNSLVVLKEKEQKEVDQFVRENFKVRQKDTAPAIQNENQESLRMGFAASESIKINKEFDR